MSNSSKVDSKLITSFCTFGVSTWDHPSLLFNSAPSSPISFVTNSHVLLFPWKFRDLHVGKLMHFVTHSSLLIFSNVATTDPISLQSFFTRENLASCFLHFGKRSNLPVTNARMIIRSKENTRNLQKELLSFNARPFYNTHVLYITNSFIQKGNHLVDHQKHVSYIIFYICC